tara:strand:- start:454 stop:1470 length:1017 start_codon:yes stop_codon:yes gene_type:complete
MVLYTEQNYEGFSEGFLDGNTNLIVNGVYSEGDTDIMLEYGIDQHVNIGEYVTGMNGGNYDIVNTTLFDAQTRIISATVEGLHIELESTTTIPNSKITTDPANNITIQVNNTTFENQDAASTTFQFEPSNTVNNISSFIIPTDTLSYSTIHGKSPGNAKVTNLEDIVGDGNLKVKLDDESIYDIKSSKLIVSVTLSSGIKQGVTNTKGELVKLAEHSHTHDHKDGFEGLENKSEEEEGEEKNEDEKEDDETKDAVKNIMDKLDIAGIIDTVKKESDKTEGFFSGERKSGNEVAGAFAGESYESEITGVAECTTTICERIHREEQLIRPVNSNEELQRV